jgi:hypothetical protein
MADTLARAKVSYKMHLQLQGVRMSDSPEFEAKVQGILKAELKRRGVTYAQLSEKLAAMGIVEAEPNIRNKLARGKFSAAFMIECLTAIGATTLRLED